MIEAHHLTFQIGKRTLLDGLDFQIRPGELLAVIGPNGAGKSTLLKLLSGQLRPSSGEVRLDGKPLAAQPLRELAQRRAVLSQHSSVPFDFTALELVQMGRMPHTSTVAANREIAFAALDQTDARHLAERSAVTLSGGELQRVQLARVLAQIWTPPATGARYLLLDEPTSSLDPAHQQQTLRIARDLAGSGVGVLIILHDLNLAAQYADRLLLLDGGREIKTGTPSEVLVSSLMTQVFRLVVLITTHPATSRPLIFFTETPASEEGLRA